LRKLDVDFEDAVFIKQLLALRLAVILCHARREPDLQGMQLAHISAHAFTLQCRPGWGAAYPQSAHLLREECLAWQKTPWELRLDAN
jgi:exopolyphosphatase/guanosine-5'-triphosphate,3'-diphosphate pyrophosphatase